MPDLTSTGSLGPMAILDANNVAVSVVQAGVDYRDPNGRVVVQAPDGYVVGMTYNGSWPDMPADPPMTTDQLVMHANAKQNALLASQWHFNLGTADAPLVVTTRLDDRGALAMLKIAKWADLNANVDGALMPYSNIDNTSATLTTKQATALVMSTALVDSQSYTVLNEVSAGILATPPTITTKADIDAAAWPVPTAP